MFYFLERIRLLQSTTDGVDRLFYQLAEIQAIAAMQVVQCTH
jgi:hypothetical protein